MILRDLNVFETKNSILSTLNEINSASQNQKETFYSHIKVFQEKNGIWFILEQRRKERLRTLYVFEIKIPLEEETQIHMENYSKILENKNLFEVNQLS